MKSRENGKKEGMVGKVRNKRSYLLLFLTCGSLVISSCGRKGDPVAPDDPTPHGISQGLKQT